MISSALLTGFVVRVSPAAVSGKKKPWSWDQYLEDERSQAAPLQLFTEVHTTDPGSAYCTFLIVFAMKIASDADMALNKYILLLKGVVLV